MAIAVSPALLGFVLAATITPGPNNIMVMASGANFGLGRSVPHLLGISAGVLVIVVLAGVGLMALLDVAPALKPVLDMLSAAYLLWFAWKIALAAPPEERGAGGRPLGFGNAALFQVVNPKIWATGLSAVALFASNQAFGSIVTVAVALAVIGLGSNALWAGMGMFFQPWLKSGQRLRVFNIAMAALLVGWLYPVLCR